MYDELNPMPTQEWTLVTWFEAVGVRSDAEIAHEVVALGLVSHDDAAWTVKRINEIKRGGSHKKAGIIHRDDALIYLTVLKAIARRNSSRLFAAERFEQDAATFLRSTACRQEFAAPTTEEMRTIFLNAGDYETPPPRDTYTSLRSKVQPAPPQELYGRDTDVQRAMQALNKCPVVVIDGVAGDGKTALAWHVAVEMVGKWRFTNFDWTTDKRYIITLDGRVITIPTASDDTSFLEKVLISLCRRFGWNDLMGAQGEKLINGCADKLRSGRYLVVVDNLETVAAADEIVRQLSDMLTPLHGLEPLSSAALITSRQQVIHPDVAGVSIIGMDAVARIPYIRHLEEQWQIVDALSDTECQQIALETDGNPLFMQLALRRYALTPTNLALEELLADMRKAKQEVFRALFSSLLKILHPTIVCFAQVIAYEITYSKSGVVYADLQRLWTEMLSHEESAITFTDAVSELKQNRILNSGQDGVFTMHALIRSYLMSLEDCG
jgi:hypothetical protein